MHSAIRAMMTVLCLSTAALAAETVPARESSLAPERQPVDLVICLDTSGSMTALIDSARMKLWDVVNELAKAKPTPKLRLGLLTYGSPNLSTAAAGWVVRQSDLTTDLDAVYAKMMAMETNGGDEFVGWVLNDALAMMSWSDDPSALKIICVAGNESADQARERFDFRQVGASAQSKGIVINAFFAGNHQQGIGQGWQDVGEYGGGYYAAISMEAGTTQIATPQDAILEKLNAELNSTYIPFGQRGRAGAANQAEQDRNAASLGEESAGSRVAAKASALYDNATWDLVDASKKNDFDMAAVEAEELPAEMRDLSLDERKKHVAQADAKRARIQQKIKDVSAEREAFIKKERAKQGHESSLDEAMRRAVRKQAEAKAFSFEDAAGTESTSKDDEGAS